MISGQMYFHKEPKKSLADIIRLLTKVYRLENVKYVLVHLDSLDKETTVDNIKIKPKKGIPPHHFWFINENNIEKRPEFAIFEK